MPLESGSHLGPYEILNPLGAGGMGEVYRARDTKLGRDVALKVLPETLAQNRERIARFTREAQLSAALNHPNIAAIYGVEEAGGGIALVLEYVDGETLADRINKGPIPLDEVLRIALHIAQALESAHEKTVIHRDLKPANVKITTEGNTKVLDFGLAKALQDEPLAAPNLSQSPTMSLGATGAGMILGTAGYMAPEQARGLAVDRRADIWAFGVVLFEMLTGRQVFAGQTIADTLVNVLQQHPDWNQLPPQTPLALRRLVQRCLAKNPKDRIQAMGDVRIALEDLIGSPAEQLITATEVPTANYPRWKKILPWALAPVFLAAGFLLKPTPAAPDRIVSKLDFPILNGQPLIHYNRRAVGISLDGKKIAFISRINNTTQPQIFVKNLDQWEPVAIVGTEAGQNPFFSPDGQWLGFLQRQQIKKVSLAGGTPITLVEKLNNPGGNWGPPSIAWGKNGTIVFSDGLGSGLRTVRDSGGEAQEFTKLDAAAGEVSHRLPHFLPDDSAVLYTVVRYTTITPNWSKAAVWAKPLNGAPKLVIENAMDGHYVGDGILVFAREAKLFAVKFDPKTLTVSGTPVQVVDGVNQALYGSSGDSWSGSAQYSVAENGTLVYAPGSFEPPLLSTLVWSDRTGKMTPIAGLRPMARFAARVLPDGKRVAFSELHLNKDIWFVDSTRATEDRATFEGQNSYPIFAPDGSRMAFRSDRSGPLTVYLASATNTRDAVQLTQGPLDVPSSWTPDGKVLAFTRGFAATGGNTDIFIVSADRPKEEKPFLATVASETFPEFSPDGKWLAYISNESGRATLYVQPYPGPGPRVTIASAGGATEPSWSKNSNELFYRSGPSLFTVRYKTSGTDFIPENPAKLFDQQAIIGGTAVRASYDIAPDGRFLLNLSIPESAGERAAKIFPSKLRLVFNWLDEVRQTLH